MPYRRNASSGAQLFAAILGVVLSLFMTGTWVVNLVELGKCDWSPQGSWKGEIVHGIGVVPGASVVTVWFSDK